MGKLRENPDIHFILAKACIEFDKDRKHLERKDGPTLEEQDSFMDSFAGLEHPCDEERVPEEILKELFPLDTGKYGCNKYCLYSGVGSSLSVAISPSWALIYISNFNKTGGKGAHCRTAFHVPRQ